MTDQPKLVDLDAFATAFFSTNMASLIWLGEDFAWHVRTETEHGLLVLAKSDGTTGYARLEGLLSILAGVGIRRIVVEWDGFPAAMRDSKTGLTNLVA